MEWSGVEWLKCGWTSKKNPTDALLCSLTPNATMGISGSRGGKVAPASVTEGDPNAQMLKCQTFSVGVSHRNTQKDRLSTRQVAQFSADNRNLAEEVDRIIEACENTGDTKRSFPKHQLSNLTDQHDTDGGRTHTADITPPTDLLKPSGIDNKTDTFGNPIKPHKQTAVTADPVCTKTTHIPGICDDISLAMPMLYNASEEDLMSAIEREFG